MKITGHYIRVDGHSAELLITKSRFVTDRYHVQGSALWGEDRPGGPNMGILEFSADLEGREMRHHEPSQEGHLLSFTFEDDVLKVEEQNSHGLYGMNVSFEGTYKRASSMLGVWAALKMAFVRLMTR
jgi:hypothetical protein